MQRLAAILLFFGLAFGQLDLSTPGGASVLATFVTNPAGAEVYVAETFVGTGPATVRINANTPTSYTVRVPGGDYDVYSGTVTLSQAGVTEVYVPRVALPSATPSPAAPPTMTNTNGVDLLLQLGACAEVTDSLQRLTCYDQLATEYSFSSYLTPSQAPYGSGNATSISPATSQTVVTAVPAPLPAPVAAPSQPVASEPVAAPEGWESRCVAAVSGSVQSRALTPAFEAVNANQSGAVQRLEEELVALDPAYTCGSFIDIDANLSTRVAKVYELDVPNLKTQVAKAVFSEHLDAMTLPRGTSLIVVMNSPTGRSGAVLKTSTGLTAIDFLQTQEAVTFNKLAESGRTFVVLGGSRSTATSSAREDLYNCSDFTSQAAAQAFFRSDPGNVNRLDGDNDGRACEALENNSYSWTPQTRLPVAQQAQPVPTSTPRISSPSPSSSGGKKCYVNGYTRKNGTRVKGYYRSC